MYLALAMRFSWNLALTGLSCAFAASSHAASEVRTAAQANSEPKYVVLIQNGKDSVGGLCVDIMRAIERVDPGIRFTGDQEWQSLVRLESSLVDGTLDAGCGLIRTPARAPKLNFIEPPLFPVKYLLAVRANDNIQVTNWDQIRKLGNQGVILSIKNFGGVLSHLEKSGGLQIDAGGANAAVNLNKLIAGRGRFFIHRSPGMQAEIARNGMSDKVKLLPTAFYHEQFHLAVAKTLPPGVAERLSKAIVQLITSGDMARMVKKWDEMPPDSRRE